MKTKSFFLSLYYVHQKDWNKFCFNASALVKYNVRKIHLGKKSKICLPIGISASVKRNFCILSEHSRISFFINSKAKSDMIFNTG
jgi:hypothetical protein